MIRRFGHKYNAKRVKKAGYSFASQLESSLHDYLVWMQKEGAIRDLKLQPSVYLTKAKILMKPDFSAVDTKTNVLCYWEAKGHETDVWRIKRRLWEFYGDGPMYVYKGSAKKLVLGEVIIPKKEIGGEE